jgi:two-component system copper resistance phosphate regulon response regulator CusR
MTRASVSKTNGNPAVNPSSRARILLIEDEAKTARAVLNSLRAEGFAPVWAETGEDGFFVLSSQHFDVVVLDWMLPGRSGLEVLKTVRAKDSKTPVLLLTARDALEDRVAGLDSGADDYLVKPFALAELAARLRALLRRATADSSAEEKPVHWHLADLDIDLTVRRVNRAGRVIDLKNSSIFCCGPRFRNYFIPVG